MGCEVMVWKKSVTRCWMLARPWVCVLVSDEESFEGKKKKGRKKDLLLQSQVVVIKNNPLESQQLDEKRVPQ